MMFPLSSSEIRLYWCARFRARGIKNSEDILYTFERSFRRDV